MPANLYHFEDHWFIPKPIDEVYAVLDKPLEYPKWWHDVYLSAEKVGESRVAVVAKGRLPYKLRFTIETVKRVKPTLIEFKASGDFRTDASRWILKERGGQTEVILDWNPIVEK